MIRIDRSPVMCAFFLFAWTCGASELQQAKLTTCAEKFCTQLSADSMSVSNLQPNIMSFGAARLSLSAVSDDHRLLKQFDGEDGYLDLAKNVIVLRGLKNSKNRELIYDMAAGEVFSLP